MAGNSRNVSKNILVNILTLYSSNQPFVRIKNQKHFGKMNFSIFLKSNSFPNFFFVKKNPKNKNFWSWKIGFWENKKLDWNMCKFVGNKQNKKQITKIKSSREIHINPYPKWYHNLNSRGTMFVWIPTMFSNP